MKSPFFVRLGLTALLLGMLSVPIESKTKPPKQLDIADTIATNRILTKFTTIIQNSDLASFLSSKGPFTIFVPTDSAFSKLPPGTLEALLRPENKVRLQDILLYHVVNGKKLMSKDLIPLTSVLSCSGDPTLPLTIHTTKSGTQLVMKAKIIHSDIKCLNGVIHEIDTVLIPPEKSLPPLATAPPPPPPATNAPAATPPDSTTNSATAPPVDGTTNAAPAATPAVQ